MSIHDITVLGGGDQWICDDVTKALLLNSVNMGEGIKRCPKLRDVIYRQPLNGMKSKYFFLLLSQVDCSFRINGEMFRRGWMCRQLPYQSRLLDRRVRLLRQLQGRVRVQLVHLLHDHQLLPALSQLLIGGCRKMPGLLNRTEGLHSR